MATKENGSVEEQAEVQPVRAAGLTDDDIACPNCGNRAVAHPKHESLATCSVCNRTYDLDTQSRDVFELECGNKTEHECPNCGQATETVKGHKGIAKCCVCGTVVETSGAMPRRLSDVR
jgi:ribosomal protein L37AE/L43A